MVGPKGCPLDGDSNRSAHPSLVPPLVWDFLGLSCHFVTRFTAGSFARVAFLACLDFEAQ